MIVSLATQASTSLDVDWLVVPVCQDAPVEEGLARLDQGLSGGFQKVRDQNDFSGKLAESAVFPVTAGISPKRILFIGLGPTDSLTVAAFSKALMTAARSISTRTIERVAVDLTTTQVGNLTLAQMVSLATTAFEVGSVGQDLFRSERKRFPIPHLDIAIPTDSQNVEITSATQQGLVLGEAVNLCRRLVNLPAEDLYPESFALEAITAANPLGLKVEVLDENDLERERMGSLLSVARGSGRPPRLVAIEYVGTSQPGAKTLALVGKGVTFDSGGLSLKPNDSMLTMKCDMAGAAAVLSAVTAIARLKLPVRVIGLMGLVENMTGGRAMKLGDVLRSRAGVTIEVQNTDAEGRLVLADVLDYALSRGADYVVDLATLTGACVVALGEEVVGAMTNNQALCDRVISASQSAGEDVWQLPMFSHYAELIKSDVADIRNVGGRWGGAITAAKFLERFVKESPWVHLDIAGPAFASSDKPHREGGATGTMVRTLVELAKTFA